MYFPNQVADLHGELIEFNEQLQKRLGFYQHQVRRLREELINLRGPVRFLNALLDTCFQYSSCVF